MHHPGLGSLAATILHMSDMTHLAVPGLDPARDDPDLDCCRDDSCLADGGPE